MSDVFETFFSVVVYLVLWAVALALIFGLAMGVQCGLSYYHTQPAPVVAAATTVPEPVVVLTDAERAANCDMWKYELELAREQDDTERLRDLIDLRPNGCSPGRPGPRRRLLNHTTIESE